MPATWSGPPSSWRPPCPRRSRSATSPSWPTRSPPSPGPTCARAGVSSPSRQPTAACPSQSASTSTRSWPRPSSTRARHWPASAVGARASRSSARPSRWHSSCRIAPSSCASATTSPRRSRTTTPRRPPGSSLEALELARRLGSRGMYNFLVGTSATGLHDEGHDWEPHAALMREALETATIAADRIRIRGLIALPRYSARPQPRRGRCRDHGDGR